MTKRRSTRRANRRNTFGGLNLELTPIEPMTNNQKRVFESEKNQVLHGCAGTGKAQPGYAKIKVPNGWSTMKDISIGDSVVTPDNKTATVTNKYYHESKPIYRIYLKDGRFVDACDEHLWKFETERKTFIGQTKDIPNLLKNNRDRLYLPLSAPIYEEPKTYSIHPYIIGALIGDGSLTVENRVIISSADSFIINKIADLLPEEVLIRKIPSSKYEYSIVSKNTNSCNFIATQLKILGLAGKSSYTKQIPLEYMSGSLEDKLNLLQGLFDTDGTVDTKNSIEFSTTSLMLANQVSELIYSLGGACSIKSRMGSCNGKDTVTNYRIRPSKLPLELKTKLFSVPRKVERIRAGQYDNSKNIKIDRIEYIGLMECWCITIDSDDSLYLTDNYIVTHNTFITSYLAYKGMSEGLYGRLVYIRSAVSTRNIGFMPGTEAEKASVYEVPYKEITNELFDRGGTYDELKKKGLVEFMLTSNIRGTTMNDSVVIVDECQNMTFHELDSIITRFGRDCTYYFCGDYKQADLSNSGIKKFFDILAELTEDFDSTEFVEDDIVRSELVKRYLIAKNRYESNIE